MGEVLSHVIERMRRIGRISIDTDLVRVALVFEAGLQAVMVRLAKRAQLASNEFRIVAAVRFYVIDDSGRLDLTVGEAKRAKRLGLQLMTSNVLPNLQRIPSLARFLRCGRIGELGGHGVYLSLSEARGEAGSGLGRPRGLGPPSRGKRPS